SGIEFDPAKVDLWFVDPAGDRKLLLYTGGKFTGYDEEDAVTYMEGEEVVMACDMHMGEASAVAWGCDLTYDYVKINADYRS
ncbi:MAG: bifunctional ornithine acetyltransferase/N-acetylglutamate synthase, partial [Lachnospiraceae bacterium]|nr:bifunctional ornithine acetyltransferase/N-acetylglutamate synthase [Lachnospiraceae bacterium]